MAEDFGGYDYRFVDQILERYTCGTICTKVLKNPHLTRCCGQHFCESCLNNRLARQLRKGCPHCLTEGREFQHFLDKKLKREIDCLRIHCTNKEEGCQWIGELEFLKDHLESANGCGFVEVECPNRCVILLTADYGPGRMVVFRRKRHSLADHLQHECYLRPYQCEHCGQRDTYEAIVDSHYSKCPHFPLQCPNGCTQDYMKRMCLEHHRSQCPLEPVECPFEEAGCKEELVRCDLEQHMSATQQQHLLMVMGAYKEIKRENEERKKENDDMKRELHQVKQELLHTKAKLSNIAGNQEADLPLPYLDSF